MTTEPMGFVEFDQDQTPHFLEVVFDDRYVAHFALGKKPSKHDNLITFSDGGKLYLLVNGSRVCPFLVEDLQTPGLREYQGEFVFRGQKYGKSYGYSFPTKQPGVNA